ncbi:ArsC/Spx/MgsR family protein [Lactococcus garvieae]|uniref:ArsC/Spx/MgsR family protein n=1 Tax=Lactococcus garvieae TaxID=1363 RepID=UPI00398E3F58
MIKMYYRGGCGSSKRALLWFQKYHLNTEKTLITCITKQELIQLLKFSEKGIKDILKRSGRIGFKNNEKIGKIMDMSFNDALDYILLHTEVLQTPIIMEGDNYLIGYNDDEIRIFLPKSYRRHHSQ